MMMRGNGYLKMTTDQTAATNLVSSDFAELKDAAKKLASDAIKLGSLGFGTTFLKWVASVAAIYLLVLDRTNWKTNILTGLLVPYIFFSLPSLLFNILHGQIGKWIAFVAVIIRIFFPKKYPEIAEYAEMPISIILIIVVAPYLFADTVRDTWIGALICLIIAAYLLQEHIRATGGFRNSFTRANGISNIIGILILVVYPVWFLITDFI